MKSPVVTGVSAVTALGRTLAETRAALEAGRSAVAPIEGPGILAQAALQDAVANGRGGKGTLFFWAAGNGGFDDDAATQQQVIKFIKQGV